MGLIDLHKPLNICRASAGTGKTFTLAAYYVGLLLAGEDYRSILAITFTNKATAEMSERIMGYLYAISRGEEDAFLMRAREFMPAHDQDTDEVLRQRAGDCFRKMLLDYDNVQVQTIDSFLQTLLSGLAGVLRMSAGLNTELDIDHVITTAVDQLLTTDLTEADSVILKDYMHLKLDEESRWDVRESLCAMAKELYNESVQMLDANGQILFDADKIGQRRIAVEKALKNNSYDRQIRSLIALAEGVNKDTGTNGGFLASARENLRSSLDTPEQMDKDTRFRGLTDKQLVKARAGGWTQLPQEAVQAIVQATDIAHEYRKYYNTLQLTIRFSRDMQLMTSLQTIIQRNLAEANSALLARTANTLSHALKDGDADFILEKAGIRYRHILIDEFQDTSRLQWTVINRLLQDVLAGEGHTLLIVGDIKQSIYRWRNGDWHIMSDLDKDSYYAPLLNKSFPQLVKNYRSSEQVVKFNLSLFRAITHSLEDAGLKDIYEEGFDETNLKNYYQCEKKPGGFVRFRAFPKRTTRHTPDEIDIPASISTHEAMTMDMFDAMETLMRQGYQPAEMMVLVREKKDAAFITSLHTDIVAHSAEYQVNGVERFPLLSSTSMVSADSFLLEASQDVNVILAAMRYFIRGDVVAQTFVEQTRGIDLASLADKFSCRLPLYEMVSELIAYLLCDKSGCYTGTETAYVNNLLDRTRAFVSAYGSNVDDFLTYWEDSMHEKPIPSSATDAIRIMTVHASKGLQSRILFVPFCQWTKETGRHSQKIWCRTAEEVSSDGDFVPIQDGGEMEKSAYNMAYVEEHRNMRVDNLNMLYVALTRAEEQLYISSEFSVTKENKLGTCNHVGAYLLDFCGLAPIVTQNDLPLTLDEAAYCEHVCGIPMQASNKDENASGGIFSFSGAQSTAADIWSNSDRVRFIQSQEGALYTDYGEESYRRMARMEEGTLCHDIFSRLSKADELEHVLDEFQTEGRIANEEQRERLKSLISSAWEGSPEMHDWFTAPWELKLEMGIFTEDHDIRPDRVMINPRTNEAIVLDYKFGQEDKEKYTDQVRKYMRALRKIGHSPVRGYLWYARNPRGKQLVEVNE